MSYEIIYDRQFLAVGEKFIPVINTGSNNCWTTNYQGRDIPSKHWTNISQNNKHIYTKDEIVALAKYLEGGSFYKTRHTPFKEGEFERYIINGMAYAQPIEFFIQRHIGFTARFGMYPTYTNVPINSTDDLIKAVNHAETTQCGFHFYFHDRDATWQKVKNVDSTKEGYYVLRYGKNYIVEESERSVTHSKSKDMALQFDTKEEMNKYLAERPYLLYSYKVTPEFVARKKVNPNAQYYVFCHDNVYLITSRDGQISHYTQDIHKATYWTSLDEIKKVEPFIFAQQPLLKIKGFPKSKFIPVEGYYVLYGNGRYFYRKTAKGYQYVPYSDAAKRFKTEKEALRYLEKYPGIKSSFSVKYINEPAFF